MPLRHRRPPSALCALWLLGTVVGSGFGPWAVAADDLNAADVAASDLNAAAVAAARNAVYPALVNLSVVAERFSDGRAVRFPSAGSGVIVTPEGHLLTNYHVAGDSVRISCTLTDGRVLRAEVVTHDPLTDLSVLKLADGNGQPVCDPCPFAALGDSDGLAVGEPVIAMGNPLALASSVTLGIVSNRERVFTDFAGSQLADLELGAGEPTGIFTRWIQHDALILPGNSGGPLVNLRGEVVGINELGGGFGFAIPSNIAAQVLRQAIADGEIRRGWLGFSVLPVTKLGLDAGALVSGVLPGSPAERAGVAPGDVLRSIAGWPVTVRFLEEVPPVYQRIADLAVGGAVTLEVVRDGERRELVATVEAMKPFRGAEGEVPALGVTVREVTEPLAMVRGFPSAAGLLLTGVRPGYPAAEARPEIVAGDVLFAIDGRPVDDLESLRHALSGEPGAGQRLLSFRHGRSELVAVARLGRDERRPWGGELPVPWLAVETQVLTPEIATALGVAGTAGFRVAEVYPGTAASRAGLATGDLLVSLDGEPFAAARPQDREDLRRAIENRSIGEPIVLGVLRDGERLEVEVELERRPPEPSQAARTQQEELGFAVRDLAFRDRVERNDPPERSGVLVVEVTPGGWAQVAGLEIGDLLLTAQGRPVADAAGFAEVMAELVAAQPPVVRLFVERGPRTHYVFIEPSWPDSDAGARPAANDPNEAAGEEPK